MPNIPYSSDSRVRQEAVPGVRVRTDAPLEAFGGGRDVAGAFGEAGAMASDAAKIMREREDKRLKEERDADMVIAMDADLQLGKASHALLYDPKTGALGRRGKDVEGLSQQVLGDFSKTADEIEKNLKTDGQKLAFQRMRKSREQGIDEDVARHVFTETKRFASDTAQAYAKQSMTDAVTNYMNPKSVTLALAKQRAVILDDARRNGADENDPTTQRQLSEWAAKTHTAVLDRMLSNQQDIAAKKYLEINRAGFGDMVADAEKAVEAGSSLGEASRLVESAFTAGAKDTGGKEYVEVPAVKTIEEFRARLPKDLDDKTREKALDLARARFRDQHLADEQQQDSGFKDAWNTIAGGGQVSPLLLRSLDPERQRALNVYAKQVAKGEQRDHSEPLVYAAFYGLTDKQLRAMTLPKLDSTIRPWMTEEDYKAAAKHWGAAHKDPQAFKSILSDQEILLEGFRKSGFGGIKKSDTMKDVEKDGDKADAFMQFKLAVDAARRKTHGDSGENPDDDEFKKIVGGVAYRMAKKVQFARYSIYDKSKLTDDDLANLGLMHDKEKRIVDLTPGEIETRFIEMPWEFRQKMYNYAAMTSGAMAKGTPFKIWEDQNRGRINRAWIATQMDAADEDVYRILVGGK